LGRSSSGGHSPKPAPRSTPNSRRKATGTRRNAARWSVEDGASIYISARGLVLDRRRVKVPSASRIRTLEGSTPRRWGSIFNQHLQSRTRYERASAPRDLGGGVNKFWHRLR
jgi:hypothetical protein